MTPDRLETILAERGPPPRSSIAEGLRLVVLRGLTVTEAARLVGVTRPSLSRSVKRLRRWDDTHPPVESEGYSAGYMQGRGAA